MKGVRHMGSLIDNLTRDTVIQDYEFTKKSSRNLNAVLSSDDFYTKSAEAIYTYLIGQMSCVKFCDYLKRYLYEHHCPPSVRTTCPWFPKDHRAGLLPLSKNG